MDTRYSTFRSQTELIASVLALAIGVGVLLRTRKRRLHWLFIALTANVSVWYLAQGLSLRLQLFQHVTGIAAITLPHVVIRLMRTLVSDTPSAQESKLERVAYVLGGLGLVLVLSPFYNHYLSRLAVSLYIIGLLTTLCVDIYRRSKATPSSLARGRARYLTGMTIALTVVFVTDVLPYIGIDIGPVGSALVLVMLFMLAQVMERSRLLDVYEFSARLVVLTALGFILAGIYYLMVDWARGQAPYVLNAIVASLVILILVDPVRAKVEEQIGRWLFRERFDLERTISALRQRLAHVLELDALGRELMQGLEGSRRVTDAALYLLDAERAGFDRFVYRGAAPSERIESASARPLLDLLEAEGGVLVGQLEREERERRDEGDVHEAVRLAEVIALGKQMEAAVVVPVTNDTKETVGLLCLRDDRVRDAFTPDDVQILRELAAQIALVMTNSKLHSRIKERDRLAVIGEMAAGLAHEIRNPLGSIKAAAQLMEGSFPKDSQEEEYLEIIMEEIGRLNRVVGSFLDYARPYKGNVEEFDINDAVRKTVALLKNDVPATVGLELSLEDGLPMVRIDPGHLRQVVMNLVRNAAEAMENKGQIVIRTQRHAGPAGLVELVVRDTGPGIAPNHMQNLFVPFFTTKAQGTGLGLAICQRLMASAGGRVELRSGAGRGSTFAVIVPAVMNEPRASLLPEPVEASARAS